MGGLEETRQPVATYDTEPRRRTGALSAADRQLVREAGAVLGAPAGGGEGGGGAGAGGELRTKPIRKRSWKPSA